MQDIVSNTQQMKSEVNHHDLASQECQEARTFLRERTLRLLTGISGKKCELHTIEDTCVTGEFKGCDINVKEFFIHNLQTPVATVPNAIVRGQDIIEICVPNICELRK